MPNCPAHNYPSTAPRSLTLDPIMQNVAAGPNGVAQLQLPHGGPCWLVTRYDDVRTVYLSKKFTRTGMTGDATPRLTASEILSGAIGSMDEHDHVKLRRAILRQLGASQLASLEGQAEHTMVTLLNDMADRGQCDYVSNIAEPFALRVLCDLLGLPYSDASRMASWVQTLLSDSSADQPAQTAMLTEIGQYVFTLIADRARTPGSDFVSALIETGDLTKKECAIVVVGMIFGGFESSATMLSKMVLKLLTSPDLWSALREDLDQVPRAIEELLRTISIAGGEAVPWRVQESVTLAGVDMVPGDYVMPATGPANLDPRVFDDPEQIRLSEKTAPHLAFGHGLHMCLGYQIARMEMNVGIRTLVQHHPDCHLQIPADQVRWRYDSTIWQLAALPVSFTNSNTQPASPRRTSA